MATVDTKDRADQLTADTVQTMEDSVRQHAYDNAVLVGDIVILDLLAGGWAWHALYIMDMMRTLLWTKPQPGDLTGHDDYDTPEENG